MNLNETIAAIATPYGKGAIGIVRISGENSIKILKKIFFPIFKKEPEPGYYYGKIKDNDKIVDEVIAVVYRAPKSFTGDDMVEINCHGGILVTSEMLNLVIKNGARLAKRGEFSFRAFINKKIDLTQAEAINDLINAKTSKAKDYALKNLFGNFSNYIVNITNTLKDILVRLEVSIDHPEEDIEFINKREIETRIKKELLRIDKLLSTAKKGCAFNYGVNVVIVGKANVGKSSLFNVLLNKDKAIVSHIPGTTRDVLEDWLDIDGIPVKLIDTAGLKDSVDAIEDAALRKTGEAIESSDIIIAMFDYSDKLDKDDKRLIDVLKNIKNRVIFILNKTDKSRGVDLDGLKMMVKKRVYQISVKEEKGITQVESAIKKIIYSQDNGEDNIVINNVRYETLLKECRNYLYNVLESIKNRMPEEIIATDIRRGLKSLEEITGVFSTDDMLDAIFSNFCLGK